MGAKTGIAWTDATWNPIRGCSRVSEGCRHCYAEQVAARFSGPGQPYHGLATVKNGHAAWTGEVRVIEERLADPLRWRTPKRIFVNSMSDLFHEKVTMSDLATIFDVMASATVSCGKRHQHDEECWQGPRHTFQILTKRPARMREMLAELPEWLAHHRPGDWTLNVALEVGDWPLPNVHLGVSVEHQAAADERIPLLLETPAAVRWISAEPLLGPIDLRSFSPFVAHLGAVGIECKHGYDACPTCDRGIDWVVVGGESGAGHRPMQMEWLAAIVEQCQRAQVPVFVKQDSGNKPGQQGRIPDDLWVQEFPAPGSAR